MLTKYTEYMLNQKYHRAYITYFLKQFLYESPFIMSEKH